MTSLINNNIVYQSIGKKDIPFNHIGHFGPFVHFGNFGHFGCLSHFVKNMTKSDRKRQNMTTSNKM